MNTQEIRLGNIVDYNDLFFEVAELRRDSMKFVGDSQWTGAELIKPVILTPQILANLGWKERSYDFTHPLDDNYELILSSDDNNGYSFLMSSINGNESVCLMTDIKHLHTLQNIFYLICSGDMSTENINVQYRRVLNY